VSGTRYNKRTFERHVCLIGRILLKNNRRSPEFKSIKSITSRSRKFGRSATVLKYTCEADDDGRERQGQRPAPTLVPLAELPSNGAAPLDDVSTQRQLALHLSRHSGPVATLRDLPAGSAGAGAGRRTDPVCNRSNGRHDLGPRPARAPPRPDAEAALRRAPPSSTPSRTP